MVKGYHFSELLLYDDTKLEINSQGLGIILNIAENWVSHSLRL